MTQTTGCQCEPAGRPYLLEGVEYCSECGLEIDWGPVIERVPIPVPPEVLAVLRNNAIEWAAADEMGYRAAMNALNEVEKLAGVKETKDVE